ADRVALVRGEVQRLPEAYRSAVVLCYLEGQTNEEAARRLNWPVGTVKGRLARARDQLRSRLSRRGVVLAAAPPALPLAEEAPAELVEATCRAASAGGASARAAKLVKGELQMMALSKVKSVTALALAVAVLAGAAGSVCRTQATEPGTARAETAEKAKAEKGKPR